MVWKAERGEKWRAQVAEMEATLAPIDEPLIAAMELDEPYRIADIGCGGGATSIEIFRRAPAGTLVHGFDLSPVLVESARVRSGEQGPDFDVADVATATAPAPPFDRLASRFGVMFFDDPLVAFANLRRWLTPGGRFAFAVWAALEENPWMTVVRQSVAEIIEVPSSDPDAPGPFRYADAVKLTTVLERAGFHNLHAFEWQGSLAIGGGLPAAEAADFALASFSSFRELLIGAGTGAFDAARRSLIARFVQLEQNGIVRAGARVHIVTGTAQDADAS